MDIEDVKKRVADIAAHQGDPEVAHSKEDDLFRDVLAAIASGAPNKAKLAAAALKSSELDFAHWYA